MNIHIKLWLFTAVIVALCIVPAATYANLEDQVDKAENTLDRDAATTEDYDNAAGDLHEAIEDNPDSDMKSPARLVLARLQMAAGRFQQALDLLEMLREGEEDDLSEHDLLSNLVLALNGTGDYTRAVEILDLLLEDDEYEDHPLRNRVIYESAYNLETVLRQYEDAVELYTMLLEEDPDYEQTPEGAFRAGYLLEHEIGDLEEAVRTYLATAKAFPDYTTEPALNPGVHNGWQTGYRALNLAGVQDNDPDTDRGLADYEFQTTICEQLADIFEDRRETLFEHMMESRLLSYDKDEVSADKDGKEKDVEGAIKWAKKALDANPESRAALRVMAANARDNREQYLVRYLQLPDLPPDEITDFALQIESLDEAQQALEAQPENVGLLHRTIQLALDEQKPEEVSEMVDRLADSTAGNTREQTWIAESLLEYALETEDTEILTNIATSPRHPRSLRAEASRQLIRMLATQGNTDRMEDEIRRYTETFGDLNAGTNRKHYEEIIDFWPSVADAYDDEEQAYADLSKLNDSDLFPPDSTFEELLNWELGRLAYATGNREEAAQHFAHHRDSTDLGADCWIAYFEAADEAGDDTTLLKLAATVDADLEGDRWDNVKDDYVDEVKNNAEDYADSDKPSEAEEQLAQLLIDEMSGADLESLQKRYNEFLQDHGDSPHGRWALMHVARLLRNAVSERRLEKFGQWLTGWVEEFDDSRDQVKILSTAADFFRASADVPPRPPVREWDIIGPFAVEDAPALDESKEPEDELDMDATYEVLDSDGENTTEDSWTDVRAEKDGFLDIAPFFMTDSRVLAYATTEIESPESQEVMLFAGFAGPGKIWINGEEVISVDDPFSPFEPDAFMKTIDLDEGTNRFLVKSVQKEEGLDWGISVRLCDLQADVTVKSRDGEQTIDATPAAEREMWKALRQAEDKASDARKPEVAMQAADILSDWTRNTEARGLYRALQDQYGALPAEQLAMSYYGWNDADDPMKDDYATRERFMEVMNHYLDNYSVNARNHLLDHYVPHAEDEHVDKAFEHADNYLRDNPGDWELVRKLWEVAKDSSTGRELGINQALQLVKEHRQSVWLANLAIETFKENFQ
ncbi:MAG: tetratricopeptide repeat protein [Planctomycetota bacterium]